MARHSGPQDRSAQARERPARAALCRAVWGLREQSKSPEARRWVADAGQTTRGSGGWRHASALTRIADVAAHPAAVAEKRGCFCVKPSRRVCPECRRHRMYSLHWPRCTAGMAAIRYSESFSYGDANVAVSGHALS